MLLLAATTWRPCQKSPVSADDNGYCRILQEQRKIRYPDNQVLSMESKKNSTDTCVTLDGEQIPSVFETVHLGIDRNTRSLVDIKKKLQLGRGTLYSLMGAGAYGNSGLNPPVSFHMWKTFALPKMLYGLEVSYLRRSDTVQLESLQRSILRRLQCLPNNTDNVTVYCLLGARPVEQEIDYKKTFPTRFHRLQWEHYRVWACPKTNGYQRQWQQQLVYSLQPITS